MNGSPENRTQRHSVIGRVWATSPRLPSRQVGSVGIEPLSIAPDDLYLPLHFTSDSSRASGLGGARTLVRGSSNRC